MEKFGIFELLDALSAIAETSSDPPSERETPEREAEQTEARKPDSSYLAPSYGAPAVENMQNGSDAANARDAYGEFLARHERAAERVEKRPRGNK